MIQGYIGKVESFKTSDIVGDPIIHGHEEYMVINPTINVLSSINYGNWNFIV